MAFMLCVIPKYCLEKKKDSRPGIRSTILYKEYAELQKQLSLSLSLSLSVASPAPKKWGVRNFFLCW